MTTLASSSQVGAWFQAMRPKTLTASIVPFIAGTALAVSRGYDFNGLLLLSALAAAIAIQIASHFINDYFDFVRGADNEERLGQKRVIQNGISTADSVYYLGLSCFAAALVFATPLINHGGIGILFVLIASILCGYMYTGGSYPLAYHGLGDIFVVIFYGWVSTLAGFWLQAGELDGKALLLGTQIGLLATALIAINNLRDVVSDSKVGKMTLPVRFGAFFGRLEITVVVILPFALNLLWYFAGYTYAAALPWLLFPIALPLVAKIWESTPSLVYNKFLALAALLHLSFGVLLCLGFLLDSPVVHG